MLTIRSRSFTTETVLFLRDVGIQIETVYANGRKETTFYDRDKIECVVLNESLTTVGCHYYLVVLLRQERDVAIPFENLKPGLKDLLPILRASKDLGFT